MHEHPRLPKQTTLCGLPETSTIAGEKYRVRHDCSTNPITLRLSHYARAVTKFPKRDPAPAPNPSRASRCGLSWRP